MQYPYTIHVNVLLLDGKIINWKTGTTRWNTVEKAFCNRQPIGILTKQGDLDTLKLNVATSSMICNSIEDNETAFNEFSENFYTLFEISPLFPDDMVQPYYE